MLGPFGEKRLRINERSCAQRQLTQPKVGANNGKHTLLQSRKRLGLIDGNSHVSFPVHCHLRYPPPSPHSSSPSFPSLSQPTQSLSMPVQDRTNEFKACVESIRNRSTISPRNAEEKQRLLHSQAKDSPKSEFTRLASAIAKDINTTTIRLGKLAQRERTISVIIPPR